MYMDITVFLAQVWGLVLLFIGIGFFASRDHYVRMYRDLSQETLATLAFAGAAIAAGISSVLAHNVWGSLPEIIVSLLGWALLLKGAFLAIAPRAAERIGTRVMSTSLMGVAGAVLVIIGIYLTWFGYFA